VFVEYAGATPIKIKSLTMGGNAPGSYFAGRTTLEAESYVLESGGLGSGLAGGGTLIKRGPAAASVRGDTSGFTGAVHVLEGTLNVDSLGTGPVRLAPGTILGTSAAPLDNSIELNDARIGAAVLVPIRGPLLVNANSALDQGEVTGPLTITAGSTLVTGHEARFRGDAQLDGALTKPTVNGVPGVVPAAGRRLSGSGTVTSDVGIGPGAVVSPGAPVTAGMDGSPTATLSIIGKYTQQADGRLVIELAPPDLVGPGKPTRGNSTSCR
jgi:autotransporter-associated beta strand protein